MRYVFLFLVTATIAACGGNVQMNGAPNGDKALKDTANYTTIQWTDSTEQAVGKINEGQIVEISWPFINSGTRPLIIASVQPGCGCTDAQGPKEPIAPGQKGVIRAKFDSNGHPGSQHKVVYVTANNSNRNSSDRDVLSFSVEVTPKK
jgi:hypothetical protein